MVSGDSRINWSKIDIITYSGDFMDDDCRAEVAKAVHLAARADELGNFKRASYIRRRLDAKRNYVMS